MKAAQSKTLAQKRPGPLAAPFPSGPPLHHRWRRAATQSLATAEDLGLADAAAHRKALESLAPGAASALLVSWLHSEPSGEVATALLSVAFTDETWAAARAVVGRSKNLDRAWLPFGMAQLGIAAVPRLVEAIADRPSKHAAFQYRLGIAACLAFEASHGRLWPEKYDAYLRFDSGWWVQPRGAMFGVSTNVHSLDCVVIPILRIAIARLPAKRARAILEAALGERIPSGKRFPVAFMALPCLAAHWRASDLPRVVELLRRTENHYPRYYGLESYDTFTDDLAELGVFPELVIEMYRTGNMRQRANPALWAIDEHEAFLASAKPRLPPAEYKRLAAFLS